MSTIEDPGKQLRLFSTAPHSCSYLDDMEASTLFIDPSQDITPEDYSYLSERGFRRSGNYIYKPNCSNCHSCISIRIPVKEYKFSRSERRILNKNKDLKVFQSSHIFTEDCYKLYADYICERHSDGDMYPPTQEQYENFLNNGIGCTHYYLFTLEESIKAVAVVDLLRDGLSAIYTFYDPHDDARSLGSLAVLWQIQYAKRLGLDYVYLGYWVKDCQKMNYKTRFKPAEIYFNKRWMQLI